MDEPLQLDEAECRVLGSLMEKHRTVPASYPLSLNALRTACNQMSSREPVTDYDERTLLQVIAGLKDRELLRAVWTGGGSRVLRYHERLTEQLGLDDPSAAVLTVLLLRGPQAPGELRARTERLHTFADRADVDVQLADMAGRGLVAELPRQPGQHDPRWAHLLAPLPVTGPTAQAPAVDLDVVLIEGAAVRDARVIAGYDAAAVGYADELLDELAHKPFDRWLLTRVAELAGLGAVADVGCGPGQVTAFLAEAGADAVGFDLSPGMIAEATARFPELSFEIGDLTRLLRPRTAGGWSAITAWYALVHLGDSEVPNAIAALARVLAPGGVLALAVHIGPDVQHMTEFFGAEVDLDFVLHDSARVLGAVSAAGLTDVEWYLRGPYENVELATQRLYVFARRAF